MGKEMLNGAFPQTFVWRNDISTAQAKKWWTEVQRVVEISFLHTKVCGNAISIIRGFYCRNIHLFPRGIFNLFMHFIYFVENIRTSLRKSTDEKMKNPTRDFYLFCKYSNIFEKNLRTNKWNISRGNKWIFLHSKNPSFEWEWLFCKLVSKTNNLNCDILFLILKINFYLDMMSRLWWIRERSGYRCRYYRVLVLMLMRVWVWVHHSWPRGSM